MTQIHGLTGGSRGNEVGSQNVRSLYDLVTIKGLKADATNPDLMTFMEMYRQGENRSGGLVAVLDPSNQLHDADRFDGPRGNACKDVDTPTKTMDDSEVMGSNSAAAATTSLWQSGLSVSMAFVGLVELVAWFCI